MALKVIKIVRLFVHCYHGNISCIADSEEWNIVYLCLVYYLDSQRDRIIGPVFNYDGSVKDNIKEILRRLGFSWSCSPPKLVVTARYEKREAKRLIDRIDPQLWTFIEYKEDNRTIIVQESWTEKQIGGDFTTGENSGKYWKM